MPVQRVQGSNASLHTTLIVLMKEKHHKKIYKVSRDGKVTIYPYLVETKHRGRLRLMLKRFLHFIKGH